MIDLVYDLELKKSILYFRVASRVDMRKRRKYEITDDQIVHFFKKDIWWSFISVVIVFALQAAAYFFWDFFF